MLPPTPPHAACSPPPSPAPPSSQFKNANRRTLRSQPGPSGLEMCGGFGSFSRLFAHIISSDSRRGCKMREDRNLFLCFIHNPARVGLLRTHLGLRFCPCLLHAIMSLGLRSFSCAPSFSPRTSGLRACDSCFTGKPANAEKPSNLSHCGVASG